MAGGRTLADLASGVSGDVRGRVDDELLISDVTHDSRSAGPGVLFVAIKGESTDGHRFVPRAVAAGSPAVCVDHPVDAGVPEVVVANTRAALGPLAALAHDLPSHSLDVIGVTGTDGKTTVTHYIESIAASAGLPVGLVGTIHTRYGNTSVASERTTPEASDFQRLLAEMREAGVSLVAVEVSSHALALHRVAGTRFAVAAFTNLSQDHLDFHGDMSSYLEAKRSLFDHHEVGTAVINVDDPAGAEIAVSYRGDLITVGERGDVRAEDRSPAPEGTSFSLAAPWGSSRVKVPVIGGFNVDNAVLAAACCMSAGIGFDAVVAGLEALAPVPGRFEKVSGNDPVTVIVDYAHTPRGISEAVSAARSMTGGRVIALAGAGGERDREKRPMMGKALSEADLALVTSDNPRSEDPDAIAEAVASGLPPDIEPLIVIDRREAIATALGAAEDGDIVLVLGRGHEPTQEMAGERQPFDDRQVVREALAKLRKSADSDAKSGRMGQ